MKWQYYFRRTGCSAASAFDADCTCWWDEGTGPYPISRHDDMPAYHEWREVAQ